MDSLFYVVLLGAVVGTCILVRILACPGTAAGRKRPSGRPAQDAPPEKDGAILWEHPLLCHHRGCRQTGDVFWQSRHGTVILCRAHAQELRQRLEEALERLEPDHP